VHAYFGLPTSEVSIVGDEEDDSLGHHLHPSILGLRYFPWEGTRERRRDARNIAVGYYAGVEAQRLVDPRPLPFHGERDDYNARSLLFEYVVRASPTRLRAEARSLVRRLAPYIERVAAELLRQSVLSGAELDSLLADMTTAP
jgi:hypothetical protein